MNELQSYQLMNEKKVANLLSISVSKLQKDRILGRGPKYVSYGRCVRYRTRDVYAFIEANTRKSTSDTQPKTHSSAPVE